MTQIEDPGEYQRRRRVTLVEDVINLACLCALFLTVMLAPKVAAARAFLGVLLVIVAVLFVRRKRRLDQLFAAMRKRQEELGGLGVPGVPGLPPGRLDGAPADDPRPKVKARRRS
jgi:hypothetical protein